ncbi:helix-turn-helix domain-containing protein [Streptomyces nogalater]
MAGKTGAEGPGWGHNWPVTDGAWDGTLAAPKRTQGGVIACHQLDAVRSGGWLDPGKEFKEGVRPGKRRLGLALRELCRQLQSDDPGESGGRPLKQAEAAKRLGCAADELSRYLNDHRIPPQDFLERLHKQACADAAISGQDVAIPSKPCWASEPVP